MHLTSLPDEILVRSFVRAIADRMQCYIASFLELKHVRALALTCTHTHAVTSDPALSVICNYKLLIIFRWREFYLRRWRGRDWPELENVPWKFRYERRLKVHDLRDQSEDRFLSYAGGAHARYSDLGAAS